MSLQEKLHRKKAESTGTSRSGGDNYSVRMAVIEHQNELMAQRIDQLAGNIEENNNSVNKSMQSVLQQSEKSNNELKRRISELETSQRGLADSFENSLNGYFKQITSEVGASFEERTDQVATNVSQSMQEIENQFKEVSEKRKKNAAILENAKFIFTNVVFVLLGIVLARALFYGFWDGFNVKGLYKWGSQWNWLKYVMWGLYVLMIGLLVGAFVQFIRKNVKNFSDL